MARSSSASTFAPNGAVPGCSRAPAASGPASTGSKPRASTRDATTATSAGASPAIAMALRPAAPGGRASASRSW
ncbi:MAG TPA: hypothetical protein VMU95_24210 [Trebonia sp.]|nr:hypothetical protein [Trebonia sp.]